MIIQVTAMGTSTQMAKMVNIHIDQFSTQNDRKSPDRRLQALRPRRPCGCLRGHEAKGRVRFASGGVGNDIKYIIELPSESGRRIRHLTDRNLAFGELFTGTRSRDYSVGAIELVLTPDGILDQWRPQ